jgi:hypothetical protein
MAYIGKNLAGVLKENKTVTTMIGDGSDTTLTLSDSPGSVNNVLLFLDGVRQTPVTNYNVSGTALTFTTAPAAGVNVVAVVGNHSGVDTRNLSVTSQKIVDGMVTDAKIATGISSSKLTGALPALDGSALTGITAVETPIFKSASDPTITSNKTLGQLWSNSTSGEMYVCTDATTNANVWYNVGDGTGNVPSYMTTTNTNGTEVTDPSDANYKIVTFNTSGSFTPTVGIGFSESDSVEYLVVAGGGGGGSNRGGGGGAGGYRTATNFTVSNTTFTVTVGGGGAGSLSHFNDATKGENSVFGSTTSSGGGYGSSTIRGATTGGSGGGGGAQNGASSTGSAGNAGSYTPAEGTAGGDGNGSGNPNSGGGGGGGASAAGVTAAGNGVGGAGGSGTANNISGSSVTYAGGGGAGGFAGAGGSGGVGGSGGGGAGAINNTSVGTAGTVNTGGGGGGTSDNTGNSDGAAGGSGIVIIRYKFQ